MTTLPDRPNTALLVVDVQNGAVAGAARRDEVVANVATLVDQARTEQVIAHTNLYWGFQEAPGRTAGTVPTADVTFGDVTFGDG
jgi:isochorismatase family protein